MKWALILIAVLLAGTLQCVAGCAMITGDAPCHHDQHDGRSSSTVCAHELVLQTPQAVLPATAPVTVEDFVDIAESTQSFESCVPLIPHVTSPPLRV